MSLAGGFLELSGYVLLSSVMPSGQRRVYEPYYYYDFESKSACVELHLCASSKLSHSSARLERRCPKHSYVNVTGFVCQGRFQATVSKRRGKEAGRQRRKKRMPRTFFRESFLSEDPRASSALRASVLERSSSTPRGNSLHCPWANDHGCSARDIAGKIVRSSFSRKINRLLRLRKWIMPCSYSIEPNEGRAP